MLGQLIDKWLSEPAISENIVSCKHFPKNEGKMFAFPASLHPSLIQAYQENGITSLYQHQMEALDAILSKKHALIVSGVASGKSLIYQASVIDSLLKTPQMTALLVFPTKALTYDQNEKFRQIVSRIPSLASAMPELIAPFDGDTPPSKRSRIIQKTQVLLTNPDLLHHTVLPRHPHWARFFTHLRVVILDEIHVYRGIFGSHVANIIRRLKRIAAHYGSKPQFILTSGTISMPQELAQKLIEEPIEIIEQSHPCQAEKQIWVYNPPLINAEFGLRRHPFEEAKRFVCDSIGADLHTILFCRSRKAVELLLLSLRDALNSSIKDIEQIIRSYRSGYLPALRREIEHNLRVGKIKAVVATNALEVGIDIGALDITILIGFPGSISSTWQQFGRSGRTARNSLGILILSDDPLDQYLAHHPNYLWESSPEQVIMNPDNPLILLSHLRCALFEIPICLENPEYGNVPDDLLSILLHNLVLKGEALKGDKAYYYLGMNPPTSFSIRSISKDDIQLILDETKSLIGVVDYESADWMVHPGAIYLQEGQSYQVESLDFEHHCASLRKCSLDSLTQPIIHSKIVSLKPTHLQELFSPDGYPFQIAVGVVELNRQVEGYLKLDRVTRLITEKRNLELPPRQLTTMAFWLSLSNELVDTLRQQEAWTNDPNRYGANWEKQKRLTRQRDKFRCQLCGMPEKEHAHHVHHKIPFRQFSTPEEANKLENLITLCPSCHRKVEDSVRIQSGLAAFGYALIHISPLFALCDRQDLGILIDPHFNWCNDLPTILIHEQVAGGIGLAMRLFEVAPQLLSTIKRHIHACPCHDGCPACTGPVAVNGLGGKSEALALLERIVH